MRTNMTLWGSVLGIGLSLIVTARADCVPPAPGEDGFVHSQILLRVADYADPGAVLAQLEAQWPGLTPIDEIPSLQTFLLSVPPQYLACEIELALVALVNPNENVPDPSRPLFWVELNYFSETGEGKTGTIFINTFPGVGQTAYREQYATGMLGLTAAQQHSDGAGVIVAILDTGVDAAHAEIADRVLPGFNFVNSSTNTADVGDGVNNDPNSDALIDEMVGHGTFVAGLVSLTAPGASLLPVVVLDSDGVGEAYKIALGIHYAIDHGADVINMSLGSTYRADVIRDAVERAENLGIPVFAAAGNENRESPQEYPAMYRNGGGGGGGSRPGQVGVAAVDDLDHRASFSNYNENLFISAPGVSMSTGGDVDQDRSIFSIIPGDDYAVWDGTSFATAFVSGAAALVRAQHPEWGNNEIGFENIIDALTDGAVDIDNLNPGFGGRLGVGRLDVAATVNLAPPAPKRGDLDNDGDVDIVDLGRMLADYSKSISPADLDGDGIVDIDDLAMLLTNYGT